MSLLILSDIHANWPALRAVIAAEPRVDAVACLGDIVNYGPHPTACIDWVRENATAGWVVQGNHDRALGCGESPRCSAAYRALAFDMQRYTEGRISPDAKDYLARLPIRATQPFEGAVIFMCHAAPSDPLYGYVAPDDIRQWERECALAGWPDFLLAGHTHLPFALRIGRTTIVNPGSVGQPKHGDPRSCYALWREGGVELRRVDYDFQSTAADLAACAPPEAALKLARILATGGDPTPAST
jgi:protein phosphatase